MPEPEFSDQHPGVYIHVPFCERICPYCDFAVTTRSRLEERWLAALVAEIERRSVTDLGPFSTLYLGGGTPSMLGLATLTQIFNVCRDRLNWAGDPWIQLEVNPEHVTRDRAEAWRCLGVQAISLGVQSWSGEELEFLGRLHTRGEALRSLETVRGVGFDWISVDLIYGLPDRSPDQLARNLDQIIQLDLAHVSAYQLTIEPRTRFGVQASRGQLQPLPDSRMADAFFQVHETLGATGLSAYEISNFARTASQRSRHNQKYWAHIPYLGFGPGAHSFDGSERSWNEPKVFAYIRDIEERGFARAGSETLDPEQRALEAVLFALRTRSGFAYADFKQRYGVDLETREQRVRWDRWRAKGWIEPTDAGCRPTLLGWSIADSLAREIDLTPTEG